MTPLIILTVGTLYTLKRLIAALSGGKGGEVHFFLFFQSFLPNFA